MPASGTRSARGYSLVELTFTLGLLATVTAMAVPQLLAGMDDALAAGAAHYVMTRFHDARMLAVMRSASVAIRFTTVDDGYEFAVFADRNHNGIRSADIARGIDVRLGDPDRLRRQFSGVEFGTVPSLPAVDDSSATVGADPIKFGASHMASFAPDGSSSSGSVYVRGRRGAQYVVRLFGDTGRIRMLKFNPVTRKWQTLQ